MFDLSIGKLPIVVILSLCRWNIPNRLKQSDVVETVHPLQGGQLQRFLGLPRCPAVYQLSFVKPVDRFCQGVVVAVAAAANGGLNASLCQSFAVPN